MLDTLDRLKAALADRYALQRELGRGGMATVYLAEDLKHHRPVALKVLRPELAAALGPDRFLREIELAARLTHPHILPLHDSGNADGFLYYVMPYVEGESLRDRLTREKQLPVDDALQISREVADALSYAHAHGVIHRDIKPENILLESGHAVVADFGIARAIDAAGGEKLTETGVALGTPAYMSPEQAGGTKDLDGRSDLYSLGCVLYEMLAGEPPFTGPTVESLVRQHLSAEPPNITNIRPSVPSWVVAALQRALAKTPADRFNPVAQFAEALGSRAPGTVVTPARAQRLWPRMALIGAAATVLVVGVVALGRWMQAGASRPAHPHTTIAVLPFENLSGEGPNVYFAGGLHDELLTQLAKVAALTVIGRTSVKGYVGTTKRLREIGDELSVGSIVEGSVQVVDGRLRVNVQLIDPLTEAHLWAERYDRTLDDAFAIQSDIAQRIVAAVGAALGETERTAIVEGPTANAEAYRLYLQGLEYFRRPGFLRGNWEIAQGLFEQAIAADSMFALAHAALSVVHGRISWWRYDTSPERLTRQREEAATALRLAPDLPQAHIAMGRMYFHGQRNWQAALKEFQIGLMGMPNDAEAWERVGSAHRRLGNWDEVLRAFDMVVALDPRNTDALGELGGQTYEFLHRYRHAVDWYSRSLALAPDVAETDMRRAWAWVLWQGRLDSIAAALDRHPPDADLAGLGSATAWNARRLLWQRKPDSVRTLLGQTQSAVFEGQAFFLPTSMYLAWADGLQGRKVAAEVAFGAARALLDSVVATRPEDWRVHAARGLALAGLGRRQEALSEARWLRASPTYGEDAFEGPALAASRAAILAATGEGNDALAEISRLLAGPSWLSIHALRLDPLYDPIRDDPRFQALLVKYDPPQPVRF